MTISAHPWDERPKPKLAQQIADEIEREIIAQGIVAGQNLGTEAELIARHGVSRAILREALLLVQRGGDRKSTRLNSSHSKQSRMPSSA